MRIWDIRNGKLLHILKGHTGWVSSVAFSPTGNTLADGSVDGTIQIYNVENGELSRTLTDNSNGPLYVAFSPDGSTLVAGSYEGTVKIWDISRGEVLPIFNPLLFRLSGDNQSVLKSGRISEGLRQAFERHNIELSQNVTVSVREEGRRWIIADKDYNNTYRVSALNNQLNFYLSAHARSVNAIAFSPDGKTVASGSDDKTVKIWDVERGEILHTFSEHSKGVFSVAFSPDGRVLASGGADKTVKIWDVQQGGLLGTFIGHADYVRTVAFSPNGKMLASASADGTVKVWDVQQGVLSHSLSGDANFVKTVAFSPNGKMLAFGGQNRVEAGMLRIWDLRRKTEQRDFSGHSSLITSISFNPDGQTLACGCWDKTIRICDIKRGVVLHSFSEHSKLVFSVAYSPDGRALASGSGDETVRVWDIRKDEIRSTFNLLLFSLILDYRALLNNGRISEDLRQEFERHNLALSQNVTVSVLKKSLRWTITDNDSEQINQRRDAAYPLVYYRKELKQEELLDLASQKPQTKIKPKWLRRWWEQPETRWVLSGGFLILLVSCGVAYYFLKRTEPMHLARHFFGRVGFDKVEKSGNVLLLHPKPDQMGGMVVLWEDEQSGSSEAIASVVDSHRRKLKGEMKLYIVYKGQEPPSGTLHDLREKLGCEIIPMLSFFLQRAVSTQDCERVLKELEEPYLTRLDPYAEFKPISDPTWFYGRDEFLKRLPQFLTQGQHVGLFGLRKVGKTSLINQLRQRFVTLPAVVIDCQELGDTKAEIYFEEILKQLHTELQSHRIKGLPELHTLPDVEVFRRQFHALFDLWGKSRPRVPFLLILDEIDRFLPRGEIENRDAILGEYVRLFRVLRGLAQNRRCLVTLVIAYRPDVNRYNQLTPRVGENPMFRSFQEEYLGFLGPAESEAMIREIGLWKQIRWDVDAAQRVFHYCGGHPLVTRLFASEACEAGELKTIGYERVEKTAEEIQQTFRRNDIGNYYEEGIWDVLRPDERQVLRLICQDGEKGITEPEMPRELEDALTNMEHFGLVKNDGGNLHLCGSLFHAWLERRIQ